MDPQQESGQNVDASSMQMDVAKLGTASKFCQFTIIAIIAFWNA